MLGAELDMEGNHCLISLQTYAGKKAKGKAVIRLKKKKKKKDKGIAAAALKTEVFFNL